MYCIDHNGPIYAPVDQSAYGNTSNKVITMYVFYCTGNTFQGIILSITCDANQILSYDTWACPMGLDIKGVPLYIFCLGNISQAIILSVICVANQIISLD